MADVILSKLLIEIEEIKTKRQEAAEYIKWGDRRLRKLGKIIHLLDEEGVVSNGSVAPNRNRYSDETKGEVCDALRGGMTYQEASEKYGVAKGTIGNWLREGWTLNG